MDVDPRDGDRGLRDGIRSAHAAGLRVNAIPNPHFPPSDEALALADEVLPNLDAVTADVVG